MMTYLQLAPASSRARSLLRVGLLSTAATTIALLLAPPASAQTTHPMPAAQPTPAIDPATGLPKGMIPITSANLAERAYNDAWPKPSFPATDRQKKQFTVEYVYRYVQSDYTPAVVVPQVKHSEAQTDTPEHTFIAFISALKTLDYDWWLSLWDTRSQQLFRDEATTKKQDAAYWKSIWQTWFTGKTITLESRIETVNDVFLEFRIGPVVPGKSGGLQPAIMRREAGRWVLTRELSEYPFLPWMDQSTLSLPLDFMQLPDYSGKPIPPAAATAQKLFFSDQTRGEDSATDFVW